MKSSISFSLESMVIQRFQDIVNLKQLDRNKVLSDLIRDYIEDQEGQKFKIKICPVCKAQYSEKLVSCPSCAMKENEIFNKDVLTAKANEEIKATIKAKRKEKDALFEKLVMYPRIIIRLDGEGRIEEADKLRKQQEDLNTQMDTLEADIKALESQLPEQD